MGLTYLDPTDEPDRTERKMCDRPETLDGTKIGLLDNGKTNSKELLEHVADRLRDSFSNLEFDVIKKPSPFKPAPDDQLQDVSVKYGAIITGIGD
jgi:hypothetical protein